MTFEPLRLRIVEAGVKKPCEVAASGAYFDFYCGPIARGRVHR